MIYFFSSSNKRDNLIHPLTVTAKSKRKAFALAVLNFTKHRLKGSPKLIQL